jgi:hypothetical protein
VAATGFALTTSAAIWLARRDAGAPGDREPLFEIGPVDPAVRVLEL